MKRKILLILMIIFTLFFIVGCKKNIVDNDSGEATGYGITHKDYVGFAEMEVVDGLVDSVTFEEVYLPSTWAKIKNPEIVPLPDDIIASGNNWLGKYIVIGGKQFTGVARTETLAINGQNYPNQAVKYSSTDIEDLYLWLRESEENCEWYVTEVLDGNAYVAKADWSKTNYNYSGEDGWTKSETGYWPAEDDRLGWSGNMQAIAEAIIGTKMDADNFEKNTEGYWTIEDAVTGATANDFPDYYEVAVRAYQKAIGLNETDNE